MRLAQQTYHQFSIKELQKELGNEVSILDFNKRKSHLPSNQYNHCINDDYDIVYRAWTSRVAMHTQDFGSATDSIGMEKKDKRIWSEFFQHFVLFVIIKSCNSAMVTVIDKETKQLI